jgi:hypothetical protein
VLNSKTNSKWPHFLSESIAGDETWLYRYVPDAEQQQMLSAF